ncbi:peptidoglycan-binding protein [Streptomyces olivoreticuli]|uniref:peptidoglycan-binding protein n=1 Tax=Streptomyces olivoreticuli TaxID=68246 RepID=UPI002657AD18|nr:peptidoglycan-binding protein [Streptomyces olivoreticuli]WKK24025.1 peptidoglycan-binding protein [Streptomyces olivoreticuli]
MARDRVRISRRHTVSTIVAAAALAGGLGLGLAQPHATAATAGPTGKAPAGQGRGTASGPTGGTWLALKDGHLAYGQDAQGNRIPDYSYAGYEGGGMPLPKATVKATVPAPGTGDATATVQAAIDKVSTLPQDADGIRGAVQLSPGQYHIAGQLHIGASGVILRGSGTGSTVLVADQPSVRTLVTIGDKSRYTPVGTTGQVTDDYVPVGSTTLTLGSTAGLSAGDEVVVERPTTQAWIDALGMTDAWTPNWSLRSERKITAIHGNKVTLDVPLTTALEKQYTQATVYKYTFPRIDHTGIENLSLDGQAMSGDPNYAKAFYNAAPWEFNAVQDSWVNNVIWRHFGGSGQTFLGPQSRRISVLHTQALDFNTTDSSARSEAYLLQGQQNLVQDCSVTAPMIHAFSTYGRQSGPNVFSNCKATLVDKTYDAGGHERWGSGTLYDNVTLDGSLLLVNNGSRGSGHGWSDANSTAYNCTTQQYMAQEPPTAHNWAIGCTGTLMNGSDGQVESNGKHVLPDSLYDQQLIDRHAAARSGRS